MWFLRCFDWLLGTAIAFTNEYWVDVKVFRLVARHCYAVAKVVWVFAEVFE